MEKDYRELFDGVRARPELRARVLDAAERQQTQGRRRRAVRPVVSAAVLAAVLTGTALAVGAATGFDLVKCFAPGEKTEVWGGEEYNVAYEFGDDGTVYFPAADLPQAVRDAASSPSGSEYSVYLNMESWGDVEEFLEMELPFSTVLEERGRMGVHAFSDSDDTEQYLCSVRLNKDLGAIDVTTVYDLDGVSVKLNVRIKTDAIKYQGSPWHGVMYSQEVDYEYEREDYLAANGIEAVLVSSIVGDEPENRLCISDAFFMMDGMACCLRAFGQDADQTLAVLKEVVDGF